MDWEEKSTSRLSLESVLQEQLGEYGHSLRLQ